MTKTDLQDLRDRIFEAVDLQELSKDLVIYELACLVPRPALEQYVADMESQGEPLCQIKGCKKTKAGRVYSINFCEDHYPGARPPALTVETFFDDPCGAFCKACGEHSTDPNHLANCLADQEAIDNAYPDEEAGTRPEITPRDGTPGYDSAAGYHD